MKITRLKSGYRISLSDGEFELLSLMVELGKGDLADEGNHTHLLSPAGKRAHGGRLSDITAMRIDEDRRK